MSPESVATFALLVFGWGLVSSRLGRADLTAPMLFVAAGVLLSEGVRAGDPEVTREIIKVLAEITLVWVLFADASRVGLKELRADARLYARLLGVGLPLTIAAGALLATVLFDGMTFWLALLVGAALAPTDAALGAAVMSDPAVPSRIRRVLNVESGLNDGIATPVVSLAIAGAVVTENVQGAPVTGGALVDLAVGLLVGVALGGVAGLAMRTARRRGWAAEDMAGPAVLAVAVAAYALTLVLDGNGFVAAFVAGLMFGSTAGRGTTKEVFYVEQTAGLASLLTWFLFGAVAVPLVVEEAEWQTLVYAVLSLTVVRMLPVALALLGSGLSWSTVAFVGWFGPRGLASVIFAVLALEDLPAEADRAVAVIATTVLLSVFAHGLSAKPLARRYGASVVGPTPARSDHRTGPGIPVRGLLHRHPDPDAGPDPDPGPKAPASGQAG